MSTRIYIKNFHGGLNLKSGMVNNLRIASMNNTCFNINIDKGNVFLGIGQMTSGLI